MSSNNDYPNTRSLGRRMSFSPSTSHLPISFGLSPSTSSSNPDSAKKDRRALLEEWRKQARSKNGNGSPALLEMESDCNLHSPMGLSLSQGSNGSKRARGDEENVQPQQRHIPPHLPRPPSSSSSEGLSAVERYRLRKQLEQKQSGLTSLPIPPLLNNSNTASDTEDDIGLLTSRLSTTTSSLNRRLTISSASKKARRQSINVLPMRSQSPFRSIQTPSPSRFEQSIRDTILEEEEVSKVNINTDTEPIDSIEGAGLRSRILEMQQRIAQLEREKMALSISKAPLEARFRQKEDAWLKEQRRLHDEIEAFKLSAKEADEQYRSLEHKFNEVDALRKQLSLEIRKQCSSNDSSRSADVSSTWSRQLQNDRDVQELRQKLRLAEEEIKSLKLEKVSLESEVHATQLELGTLVKDYNDLEEEFRELEASKSQASDAQIQLEVLTREHIATAAQLNAVCSDFAAIKSSSEAALNEVQHKWKEETSQLKFEIAVLKTRGAANDDESSLLNSSVEDEAVLRARIEERDARIADLEAQLIKGEQLRRSMHNRIQELRGNIRVFVRTRPFLPADGASSESSIAVARDGQTISIKDKSSKSQDFSFDKVFSPSSGQDTIFEEVSEFVQSALDGYHVCLFSYGQTGSGKTHTMQGSGNGRMRGIIPRAVEQILMQVKELQGQKWAFNLSASFLEIYNEDLRDLLASITVTDGMAKRPMSANNNNSSKLAIKHDINGKSYVEGLTKMKIETNASDEGLHQLESLMAVAARARTVASTNMNAQSSRSHSVFMLHLRGHNADSDTVVEGALNLCDLAGSERLDRSGAASDAKTLRETQAINKSLSSLGDVFNALANKSKHIPYRNSKLTYLLQDCLSGDGKALMFVNLSPTMESSNESLCSLRFAQRVNQIELGKPTKNVQYGGRPL
eukprot:CAMPEP_0172421734 /NCGR_PEP_ID=MMETSP1064-20121228/7953_1 /TAXON_ID=202472 /ORGANISM="Aulacoseira subarctica , Strain CCAP 1002/5" /LENGTH=913 /DNA_ID=CAMNT_0013162273 /DNA_START=15 /DNA_END=2756 /DNA_ORIENTATION=+